MNYPSETLLRYIAYCRRTGKRFSWAGMGDWREAGCPTDRWAGTVLDQVVRRHMRENGQLPLIEEE